MNILKYFHNMSLQYRLTLLISTAVLVSGISIYAVGSMQYRQTIIAEAINHLKTIRENRIRDIRKHLEQQLYNLDTLAEEPLIKQTLAAYQHRDFGPSITAPSYQKVNRQLASYLSYYRQKAGYDDMFLISPGGDIFYTLAKESDLGTNLVTGKYRDTQLANVFHHAAFLLSAQISTISYYPPSNEAAKFLITPVFEHDTILGFIAIQLNLSELSNVITSLSGLGHTGEVVAGILDKPESQSQNSGWMSSNPTLSPFSGWNEIHGGSMDRSSSAEMGHRGEADRRSRALHLTPKSALLVAPLRHAPDAAMNQSIPLGTERARPLQQALQGKIGNAASIDYRGVAVEAAWGYVPEMELGVVVKIDRHELLEPVVRLQHTFIIVVLLILVLTIYAATAFARSISTPIKKLTEITRLRAKGQFNLRSTVYYNDEVGQLSEAFNLMADNLRNYYEQIHQQNKKLKTYGEQLEQRVQERTATLTAANEEVRSFAYIVSHDLRSPLVNMRGFTGELDYALKEISKKIEPLLSSLKERDQQEMQQLIEEDIPESMQFITSSVQKMDHMLSAILTLSRLGRRELKFESVDLHALCDGILKSLSYQIDQSHTKATLGDLPVIENDQMVMQQIMGNLIGNAVKYLHPDRPGRIEVSSVSSDSGITITVRDNGHGILPEEKGKVFQIFRRGIHQDVKGEGMGLPYVQTLVRAQGGSISFAPAPNHGTIFAVFIPLQKRGGKI